MEPDVVVELWEIVKSHIKPTSRIDVAKEILELLEDNSLIDEDDTNFDEMYGVDDYLDQALDDYLGVDTDLDEDEDE